MQRFILAAAATALMTIAAMPACASPTIPGVVRQAAGAYSFTIGEAKVTALSDGSMPMDVHRTLKGISPAEIDALLARSFLANPTEPSINAFLIEMNERTVLVDTGAGGLFGPGNGGRLPEALVAAGVRPDEIDDILITHTHPDHIGGLVNDGQMAFPKAKVHVGKPDLDFFLSPRYTGNPRLAEQIKTMFKPYMDAGRVQGFERSGELLPGITVELRPGHSPGSAVFTLMSQKQQLVIIGDIIHVAVVQLYRPDVTFIFDENPSEARADRERAFRDFARAGTLIASPHMSFPGVGHIGAEGRTYRWFPIEYANRDPHVSMPKL